MRTRNAAVDPRRTPSRPILSPASRGAQAPLLRIASALAALGWAFALWEMMK